MSNNAIKILLVGPCKAGKTAIANFLAGRADTPNLEYTPTAGVRILEFDASTSGGQRWGRGGSESVELWDCSGDKQYEKCFPAFMKGAVGVIIVYNPEEQSHVGELNYWCDIFLAPMNLRAEQVIVFQHRPKASSLPQKERSRTGPLRAFDQGPTSLNVNAPKMKQRFEDFTEICSEVASKRSEQDLEAL
jgi:Rab-like protein 5|eukprot:SAG25_NODE_807_length_5249_cov_3.894369_1_plen_190_part_00